VIITKYGPDPIGAVIARLGEDWWQSCIPEHDSEPDIDLEAF
jgi:hypothetical protein